MSTLLNETIFHPMFVVTVLLNLEAMVLFATSIACIHDELKDKGNMTVWDYMFEVPLAPLTMVCYLLKMARALEARRQARDERKRKQAEMDAKVKNYMATGRF